MIHTGFILAGGKSSRMGEDKGLILLNEKRMVEYTINLLEKFKIKTTIVTNNEDYKLFGLPIIKDIHHNIGPIGGIFTALKHSDELDNIFLPCDMPFLNIDVLNFLLKKSNSTYAINVISNHGRLHPLIGIYNKKIIPILEQHIEGGNYKVQSVFAEAGANIIECNFSNEIFRNINDRNELLSIENRVE